MSEADPGRTRKLLGFTYVALACLCWAGTNILVKYVLSAGVAPFEAAGARAIIGFLTVILAVGLARPRLLSVRRRELFQIAAYGVVAWGLATTIGFTSIELNPVAVAILLLYTSPLFTLAWSAFVAAEGVRRHELVAALVVLVGVALVARAYEPAGLLVNWVGVAVGLCAAMGFSFTTIFGKRAVAHHHPGTILVYGMAAASLFWMTTGSPVRFLLGGHDLAIWAAVVGIAVGAGLPSVGLYLLAMRTIRSAEANLSASLEPVFTLILAFAILAERLEPGQLVGAAVLLGGVVYLHAAGVRVGAGRAHGGDAPGRGK